MAYGNLPPAYIKSGEIRSYETDELLHDYEGLVGFHHRDNGYILYRGQYHGDYFLAVVHPGTYLDDDAVKIFMEALQ